MFTQIEMHQQGTFHATAVCTDEEEQEYVEEGLVFDGAGWRRDCTAGVKFLIWRGGGSIVIHHPELLADDG